MTLYDVIAKIAPRLAESPQIHAMWLEGSWANRTNNDESDIDVWLDVADGSQDEVINVFRNALKSVGTIDWENMKGVYSTDPKLVKHAFHLLGYPTSQRIELDLQEHSRGFVFDRREHTIEVLFDKDETVNWVN